MIQPGMMFGGEGPVMQGTWYNPQTGDAFTVRDSFFEDNQYVVTTTDGRYLRYNQLQNYVQSDMRLEDLKQMKSETKSAPATEELPAAVSSLIDNDDIYFGDMIVPEDNDILSKPMSAPKLGNIHQPIQAQSSPVGYTTQEPVNMNTAIIEKALKNSAKPDFSVTVKWNEYPEKQIEMLKDIMEIPAEEIVDWYLDNIKLEDFIAAFKTAIIERIHCCVKAEQVCVDEPVEVVTPIETIVADVEPEKPKTRRPRTSKK